MPEIIASTRLQSLVILSAVLTNTQRPSATPTVRSFLFVFDRCFLFDPAVVPADCCLLRSVLLLRTGRFNRSLFESQVLCDRHIMVDVLFLTKIVVGGGGGVRLRPRSTWTTVRIYTSDVYIMYTFRIYDVVCKCM